MAGKFWTTILKILKYLFTVLFTYLSMHILFMLFLGVLFIRFSNSSVYDIAPILPWIENQRSPTILLREHLSDFFANFVCPHCALDMSRNRSISLIQQISRIHSLWVKLANMSGINKIIGQKIPHKSLQIQQAICEMESKKISSVIHQKTDQKLPF